MRQHFGYIFVSSAFVPEGQSFELSMAKYAAALDDIGGVPWTPETMSGTRPLVCFMTTGGTEQALLDIRDKRREMVSEEPVLIVAHPAHNSLAASLEVLARIQQEGAQGRVLYLQDPQDDEGLQKITDVLTDYQVSAAMKQARIGLLGTPSDWLVASSPEHETVKSTWGPEVVPISLGEVNKRIQEIPDEALSATYRDLIEGAREVREPSPQDTNDAIKVYFALKKIIETYRLDAFSIRCFDLVLGLKTTGCYGLSQLTDDGIIAGCEGDMVSTIGLFWVKELLGKTPWMANPAQLDEVNNSLWLAHCTVPRSITEDYGLRSHFESGLGVGIQGTLANGPVTLLRIGGQRMEKIWLAEGEITQSGKAEDLCRTQAQIQLSDGKISDLLENPLGNHIVLVQGHHLKRLHGWWQQMIA